MAGAEAAVPALCLGQKVDFPGFPVDLYLPLYGFGACLLLLPASAPITFLPEVLRVLTMGAAMTLIALISGKIFIAGMHVRQWNHSKKPGNIPGILCPEFTLYWMLPGAICCYGIHCRSAAPETTTQWKYDRFTG